MDFQASTMPYINFLNAIRKALPRIRHLRFANREPLIAEHKTPELSDTEKLVDTVIGSHDVLYEASAVFPFVLFPDTVVVDREKVTIANRLFFRAARVNSIMIKNVTNVEVDVGPLFGSLKISSNYFGSQPNAEPECVNFLWRKDALKLHDLLQGYIIAHHKEIDCTDIEKNQLKTLLYDLGQGVRN